MLTGSNSRHILWAGIESYSGLREANTYMTTSTSIQALQEQVQLDTSNRVLLSRVTTQSVLHLLQD